MVFLGREGIKSHFEHHGLYNVSSWTSRLCQPCPCFQQEGSHRNLYARIFLLHYKPQILSLPKDALSFQATIACKIFSISSFQDPVALLRTRYQVPLLLSNSLGHFLLQAPSQHWDPSSYQRNLILFHFSGPGQVKGIVCPIRAFFCCQHLDLGAYSCELSLHT